ncbi:MAG: hypothetical protein R2751_14705 [Bacteroidales bacterium]
MKSWPPSGSVARGDSYFSKEVSAILIEQLHRPSANLPKEEVALTARETKSSG